MISITLNPCIDKTVNINNLVPYGLNRITSSRKDIGGKGINVARVLKTFGEKVVLAGFLGKENNEIFEIFFQQNSMENRFTMVNGRVRTNTKIVDDSCQKTTELNETGFKISPIEYDSFLQEISNIIENEQILFLSGSIPEGIPENIYQIITEIANYHGLKVILDADGKAFMHGVKAVPYAVKPNLCELEGYSGICCHSQDIIVQKSLDLINDGVKIVLVSLGEMGAIISDENQSFIAIPWDSSGNIKSTVGAGDSMTGTLGWCIENGISLEQTAKMCVSAGTVTACKEGTQLATFEEITAFVDKVNTKSIRN